MADHGRPLGFQAGMAGPLANRASASPTIQPPAPSPGAVMGQALVMEAPAVPSAQPITAKQRTLLRLVWRHHDEWGEHAPISLLARRLGVAEPTVRARLEQLVAKGWARIPRPEGVLYRPSE